MGDINFPTPFRMFVKEASTALISIILTLSIFFIPSNVLAEQDEILIEGNITWEGEMILDDDIIIANGASLTITNSEIIASGEVEVFVDSKSSLIIEDSKFISENPPSYLVGFGYCDYENRSAIKIPWSDQSEEAIITFRAINSGTFDGVTVYHRESIYNLSGAEDSISVIGGFSDYWIEFVGPNCYPVSLSEVEVSTSENLDSVLFNAGDLIHKNMMLYGDYELFFEIQGNLLLESSTIEGSKFTSVGDIVVKNSTLSRVGPIILNSNLASIELSGDTRFSNSTDDHDIRAKAESTIDWGDDVTGSGGLTDKWERRIAGQFLKFDIGFVTYEILGMFNSPIYTNFSNDEGISYIRGGNERVIEIAWSDDNTWEENEIWKEVAIVNILSYRTAWNPEITDMENYGGSFILGTELDILVDWDIPNIEWVSLDINTSIEEGEKIAKIGDSLPIYATLKNSGSASAMFSIDCNISSTGNPAVISPSYPHITLGAGDQGIISFKWRNSEIGNESLDCRVLTPTQLIEDDAFGGGEITSSMVVWEEEGDEAGLVYIMPVLVALIVGIIIYGRQLINQAKRI